MSEDWDWREDSNGRISCFSCREPVGKPFWPGGCCCGDFEEIPTDQHRGMLNRMNNAWDSMIPEPIDPALD